MLNLRTRKSALAHLESVVSRYEKLVAEVAAAATALHEVRAEVGYHAILAVEAYVNRLANSPKEFQKTVGELRTEYDRFAHVVALFAGQAERVSTLGASFAGVGVGAGVGVAALAPTAALGIATTFGVASTGTAISALSGAAATKAALAWLGGGALAAGGGGMAAGGALMALAGPVGWTLGGFAVVGSAVYARAKNQDIARKATVETLTVEARISTLNGVLLEISQLSQLTRTHADGVRALIRELESAPRDYAALSASDVRKLGALINAVRALSELLNRKVTA